MATNNAVNNAITGNAGTATALQNARTVNNVSFNGTANITLQNRFMAYLNGTNSNVTGDGTTYVLAGLTAVTNDDTMLNTTSGVVTIPFNGFLQIAGGISLLEVGTLHTTLVLTYLVNSTRYEVVSIGDAGTSRRSDGNLIAGMSSLMIPVSTNDTVSVEITVLGSTKTIDVTGSSSFRDTFFTGILWR